MRYLAVLTLAWLLPLPTAQAQEKFTVKLKEIGVGESLRSESRQNTVFKTKVVVEKEKDPGKADEQKMSKHLLFTETVLERADAAKRPSKIRRVYEKAVAEPAPPSKGAGKGEMSYHGKIVLIEKKDDKYQFRFDGGEVVTDAAELEGEFNNPQDEALKRFFLPTGAVAAGETWKIDTTVLTKGFPKHLGIQKASGTGKLAKVYKKDGRFFGVLEASVELALKGSKREDKDAKTKIEVSEEQKFVLKITFDGCIDGSFAEGRLVGQMEFSSTTVSRQADQPAITSIFTGTSTGEDSWREIPKK